MQNIFDLFTHEYYLFVGVVVFFGIMVGSFLNVVIYRVPKILEQQWQQECVAFIEAKLDSSELANDDISLLKKCVDLLSVTASRFNLLFPSSHCPVCKSQVHPLNNIPLLSFLLLRGKCSVCKTAISWRYPAIELLTGLLFGVMACKFGLSWILLGALFFVSMLMVLTFIDVDTHLLPDNLTLGLLWAGLLFNLLTSHVSLYNSIIGAVCGYLLLWAIFWIFKIITGKDGMGYGDFKLLSALGAWLGWQQLPVVILMSSVVGAIFGVFLIISGRNRKSTPLPFGPYLAGAGLITFLWGSNIVAWYLNAT